MAIPDQRHDPPRRHVLPVWYGMGLGMWLRLLRQRPPIHRSRVGRLAGVTIATTANSLLHVAEKAWYGRKIEQTSLTEPPLFILGHWRSGTTLLHNLLARDPRFVAPTHYQVSFPTHFLLTERFFSRVGSKLLPARRPMDEMALRWDLPGEDEVALLLTTLLSPYLRAAFPAGGPLVDRLDDLLRNLSHAERLQWKQAFLYFLKKVSLRQSKTPLLKSPAHTARIPLLLELFPSAKFVYIVRNPYDVFSSTRHLYQVLSNANSLTRTAPADLDERVFVGYQGLYNAYHLHRALIPPHRRLEIRFEELIAEPLETLRSLYAHHALDNFDTFRLIVEPELRHLGEHRQNSYGLDNPLKQEVYERWGPAFRRYGYSA